MTEAERIIKESKICILQSGITNTLYLDDDQSAHVFTDETEAAEMAGKIEAAFCTPPRQYNLGGVAAEFYRLGAAQIIVHDHQKTLRHELSEKYVRPGYYNNKLTAIILWFHQNPGMECLKGLPECRFLLACKVTERVNIAYAAARIEGDKYILGFSDLNEYNKWGKEKEPWRPLEVDFEMLCRIAKGCGIILNPDGNQMILPERLLDVKQEDLS